MCSREHDDEQMNAVCECIQLLVRVVQCSSAACMKMK